jgi:carbon storage regulator
MLVLSREKDQSIVLNDDCILTVTSLTKESATLTFVTDGQENKVAKLKKNETVKVKDDEVTIVLVEIRKVGATGPLKVRLGVEAPREMPVHRKEVWDAIMRNEPS